MTSPAAFLLILFPVGGIILTIAGILIISRLYGKRSVEVDAECLGVNIKDVHMGSSPNDDQTIYHNTQTPVYRYTYQGKQYTSSPLLSSNRPGYHPETGYCKIRINPNKPEKVYSSERKFAGVILMIIGVSWVLVPVLVKFLFARFM